MKILDLISHLDKLHKKYGNLDVYLFPATKPFRLCKRDVKIASIKKEVIGIDCYV